MISRWRLKALAQKVFSHVPAGERLNYVAQRYLRRSLRVNDSAVQGAFRHVRDCMAILERQGLTLSETTAFEFGAGWFLLKQLLLSLYGCKRQITVDLRPLATVPLINEALTAIGQCGSSLAPFTRALRPISSLDDLRYFYGIWYLAPFDARRSLLESGSVDLVSSTATLEHIPPHDIRAIVRESRRLLAPGGLAIHYVDYTDHFAHTDPSISVYNFLRFSEREWNRYNSFIHYQNRMRHVDYVGLFAEEGFALVEEHGDHPSAADVEALGQVPLAPEFATYPLDQLAIQGALFVLRPSPTPSSARVTATRRS